MMVVCKELLRSLKSLQPLIEEANLLTGEHMLKVCPLPNHPNCALWYKRCPIEKHAAWHRMPACLAGRCPPIGCLRGLPWQGAQTRYET
eukprot:1799999-Amphidinium_carterae.1